MGLGATAGIETQTELQRGRPKPRMFNDPGTGVHIYPKQMLRIGKMERAQAAQSRLLEEVGGDRDKHGALMRCPALYQPPGKQQGTQQVKSHLLGGLNSAEGETKHRHINVGCNIRQ